MRILLVEDHPAVAEMSVSLLTIGFGHEVEHVWSGAEALEAAQRIKPDLILIDIGLPGIDGYEVARRLREQERFAATPLVALTGYAQYEDRQRAFDAGFDAHFAKPMDFSDLTNIQRRR